MYNLTYDTEYDRNIVRRLMAFQRRQDQPAYVPTTMEPEHLTHNLIPPLAKSKKRKNQ